MPLMGADKPLFDNSNRSKIMCPMYDGGKIVRVVVSSRIIRKLALQDEIARCRAMRLLINIAGESKKQPVANTTRAFSRTAKCTF